MRQIAVNGIDGLADNRGRTKPRSEMTNKEKLRAENKMLETKIKEWEMENTFLKKIEGTERMRLPTGARNESNYKAAPSQLYTLTPLQIAANMLIL